MPASLTFSGKALIIGGGVYISELLRQSLTRLTSVQTLPLQTPVAYVQVAILRGENRQIHFHRSIILNRNFRPPSFLVPPIDNPV